MALPAAYYDVHSKLLARMNLILYIHAAGCDLIYLSSIYMKVGLIVLARYHLLYG